MNSSAAPARLVPPRKLRGLRPLCVLIALSYVGSAFAATEPGVIDGQRKNFTHSWRQEVQIGAQADNQVVREIGVYENAQLQSYVQAVGERVLAHSDFKSPSVPDLYRDAVFTFRVIDRPEANAVALPGGYVYVTRGLLAHVHNEAQLAAVLGHQIAHVAARHRSQQDMRGVLGQVGAILGAVLGQQIPGDPPRDAAASGIVDDPARALEMFAVRHTREAEQEADNLGIAYATRAGYAAGDVGRLFETLHRLPAGGGTTLPGWQTTHPDPGDRAPRVAQIAGAASAQGRADNTGEEPYLRHIEGLVVGNDPRTGLAQGGMYFHPALGVQLPVMPGWNVESRRGSVAFVDSGARATLTLRPIQGTRARDAVIQFAQQQNVQVTASGDTVVNGLPTSVVMGEVSTAEGAVSVWNAVVEMDGRLFSILGRVPANSFEQVRPLFETVAAGFDRLRVPELARVEPARLRIVRADRGAPFASFIPASLPPDLDADAVAAMNQLNPNETVEEGRLLKLPDAPPRPFVPAAAGPAGAPSAYPPYGYPQQGGYGTPSSPPGYPPASPGYPPASTYPPQPGQPSQHPGYPPPPQAPAQHPPPQYPDQRYPTPPAGQPQWPGQPQGTGYPETRQPPTGLPPHQQPEPYPRQTTYPPTPGGQQPPPPAYPSTGYPTPGAGHPSQPGTTYPPQTGTGTTHPPQTSQPQFPQPPGASHRGNQPPQSAPPPSYPQQHPQQHPQQSQPPVWPR
jgi:predicted Zn-dependent protease